MTCFYSFPRKCRLHDWMDLKECRDALYERSCKLSCLASWLQWFSRHRSPHCKYRLRLPRHPTRMAACASLFTFSLLLAAYEQVSPQVLLPLKGEPVSLGWVLGYSLWISWKTETACICSLTHLSPSVCLPCDFSLSCFAMTCCFFKFRFLLRSGIPSLNLELMIRVAEMNDVNTRPAIQRCLDPEKQVVTQRIALRCLHDSEIHSLKRHLRNKYHSR